jgi:hypothetical protein
VPKAKGASSDFGGGLLHSTERSIEMFRTFALSTAAFAALPLTLSFVPVIALMLPFLLLSAPAILAVVGLLMYCRRNSEAVRLKLEGLAKAATQWLVFTFPFHGVVVLTTVAFFSFAWSVGVGAMFFVFPHFLDSIRLPRVEKEVKRLGLEPVPAKKWEFILELFGPFASVIFEYFPVSIVKTPSCILQADTPYIYGYHPHGMFAFGLFSMVFPKESGWNKIASGSGPAGAYREQRQVLVAVANSLLRMPFVGHIFAWFGFVSAEKESLHNVLATSDHSLAIIPGKQ